MEESRDEDRHLLKSERVEERGGNTRNLSLNDKSRNGPEDLQERGQNNRGKVPLSDVTNSNLANPLDRTKHHEVKKEQQAQQQHHHHSVKFDAFLTPEHQPFQTTWSTVFYTPDDDDHHQTPINSDSTHPPLAKRGCYVVKLSPTGCIAALAINRKEVSNTAVVFFSPLVDASMSSPLYLSKAKEKTGRYTET